MATRSVGPGAWTAPAQAELKMQITYSGNYGTQPIVPDTLLNQYSPMKVETQDLTNGVDTTITVPTKASGVLIIPPSGNTLGLTLKGIAADTGVVSGKLGFILLSFDATPIASFVLKNTGGSTMSGVQFVWF